MASTCVCDPQLRWAMPAAGVMSARATPAKRPEGFASFGPCSTTSAGRDAPSASNISDRKAIRMVRRLWSDSGGWIKRRRLLQPQLRLHLLRQLGRDHTVGIVNQPLQFRPRQDVEVL